ncbi:MAG: SGNH/GDSL hydrolase family protein [Terriglobales bacterium]
MKNITTSTQNFAASVSLSIAFLLGMLALKVLEPHLPTRGIEGALRGAIAILRGRDAPWERLTRASVETSGYYEKLLNGSKEEGDRSLLLRLWRGKPPVGPELYVRGGFLIYEPKPHLNFAMSEDGNFVTNSLGLIDREHSVNKPAGTVRIALIGDSQTRGRGLNNPNRQRFGTLLEQRLNSDLPSDRIKQVEVLNFAVGGYRPTQEYYVATEKAPPYQPDVYLFTLTSLCIEPPAGAHLAEVVREGIDPRYDFMRDIIERAKVQRSDSLGIAQMKLAPYRFLLLREILLRLKSQATQQGAVFAIVLLPAAESQRVTMKRFEGVHELVEGIGVPIIDLLNTYDQVSDIESVRTFWSDPHPNAAGHQLIADNLYRKLRAQPVVWLALGGRERPADVVATKQRSVSGASP